MSVAQRVFHGNFGRVALLNMNSPLVMHAHSECHVLVKVAGDDTFFNVRGRQVPLTDGGRVCMQLPKKIPKDLNRQWYVDYAHKMLQEMGVVL